ncbi:TPR repeat-containing protein DDB_G0287407-like [Gigantopelta aegis]|uniref:TPR repeat-containing protein DDB_G0287407-like n=1 Tax=Gigantopelta aegis TaxID=1735272 RepID=UPI001B889D56|nr:TPR repeat-containing protein DDB_G0287407-like [Gigantopelta aegis]
MENFENTPSVIKKKPPGAMANNTNSNNKVDSWQNVDVAKLMSDLHLGGTDLSDVNWWDVVDHLRVKQDPVVKAMKKRKTWKTVRLFISSTFKDMGCEREYLVKTIIPTLRQWCEERKLKLIECDLRWGVPKDADARETILACLSEIDRCREENEYPYFLGMLSERYGYVMKSEDVPEDLKLRYKWLPGVSMTALEIFTGAYWDRNPHALYMLRNPDFLKSVQDDDVRMNYVESKTDHKNSLAILKGKVCQHFPDQVVEYSTRFDKVSGSKIMLTGLEDFGQTVLTFFKTKLSQQYPDDCLNEELTETEELYSQQKDFMLQRGQILLGRDALLERINNYLDREEKKDKILSLVGFPGAGKSALMASSAKTSCSDSKNKVFFHFTGATPDSTNIYSILSRVFHECMPSGSVIPIDQDEMMHFVPTMLKRSAEHAKQQGYERLILYIDALNQMDNEGNAHQLTWLPRQLPKSLKLIVSTLEGTCLDALRSHDIKPQELAVEPLSAEVREDIATKILMEYNKQLDSEQMAVLIEKKDAGRPLWLSVACEELRVFGEFRSLTTKITSLPEELGGLLQEVLRRVVTEYGGELVQATLCLIETSRFGLSETELLEMLTMKPTIPDTSGSHTSKMKIHGKIPMAKWALVYLGLRSFMRPCGTSGVGRLDFYHRSMSKAVRLMYLGDDTNTTLWQQRLAAYFNLCQDLTRKCEELPYQLMSMKDKDGLKECLLQREVFEQLYAQKSRQQLMKYWQFIGGYSIAAKEYTRFLDDYIKKHNLSNTDEGIELKTKVAWFLLDIGEYSTAHALLEVVLKECEEKYGKYGKELADPLFAIMTLLYRRALTYVYNSHPGYAECVRLGKQYGPWCEKVHKQHWPDYNDHLGMVLTVCGYFDGTMLQYCLDTFKRTNNRQGLAEVLYMLGEKNQYNKDINIPVKYFEQSLTLCLTAFGRFHLKTARCYQLYGQLYWNQWSNQSHNTDYLNKTLDLYKVELELLEEVQGKNHPNTVRSREDVIIILQNLNRNPEANQLAKLQPKESVAIA